MMDTITKAMSDVMSARGQGLLTAPNSSEDLQGPKIPATTLESEYFHDENGGGDLFAPKIF